MVVPDYSCCFAVLVDSSILPPNDLLAAGLNDTPLAVPWLALEIKNDPTRSCRPSHRPRRHCHQNCSCAAVVDVDAAVVATVLRKVVVNNDGFVVVVAAAVAAAVDVET